MTDYLVVFESDGQRFALSVTSDSRKEALREAKRRVRREFRDIIELRVKSAERIAV